MTKTLPFPTAFSPITDRERFLAVLTTGPLLASDAIVVLCGEDANPRLDIGIHLLSQGAAPTIVLSGGVHHLPRKRGANSASDRLIGHGVSRDRIVIEDTSLNTHEQARNVLALAQERAWKQILLVASAYHLPRAFLTFVRELDRRDLADLRVLPVPASQSSWLTSPDGMTETRMESLATEYEKIDRYTLHVASYAQGLAYLARWDRRGPT